MVCHVIADVTVCLIMVNITAIADIRVCHDVTVDITVCQVIIAGTMLYVN